RTDVVVERALQTIGSATAFGRDNFIVVVLFKLNKGRRLNTGSNADVPDREIDCAELCIKSGPALLVVPVIIEVGNVKGIGGIVNIVFRIIGIVFFFNVHISERGSKEKLVAIISTQRDARFGNTTLGFHFPELLHFAELAQTNEGWLSIYFRIVNDTGRIGYVFNVIGIIGVGQSVTSVGIISQVGEIGGNGAAWVVTLV